MTEFQKEISVVALLLVFLLGCFCYVEIAHTEATGGSLRAGQTMEVQVTKKAVGLAGGKSKSVKAVERNGAL